MSRPIFIFLGGLSTYPQIQPPSSQPLNLPGHCFNPIFRTLDLSSPTVANRAVHCFKMPSLAKSPPTCDAFRRSASAMLVTPMVRSKPIVAFRKAAITSGPERLRIRLASSPIVTSRT